MSRLIDEDELLLRVIGYRGNVDRSVAKRLILQSPDVEVVSVVRCGECKYYDEKDHNCLDEMAYARCWMPTDFCSFGERKDDGDNR